MLAVWTGRRLTARAIEILDLVDTDTGKPGGKTLGELTVGEGLVELRRTARVLGRATGIAAQDLKQDSTRSEKSSARKVLKEFAELSLAVTDMLAKISALKPRAGEMQAARESEQQTKGERP
jgi:hypothetical protein